MAWALPWGNLMDAGRANQRLVLVILDKHPFALAGEQLMMESFGNGVCYHAGLAGNISAAAMLERSQSSSLPAMDDTGSPFNQITGGLNAQLVAPHS
eukprot:scaffold122978_cov20-Prasinocladus_malaysianus.AAC.1